MMTHGEIKLTDEFASTMQQLVAEAEKNISPEAFAKVIESEIAKWARIAKQAGIHAE